MASVRLTMEARRVVIRRVEEILKARHLTIDSISHSVSDVYHNLVLSHEDYKRVKELDEDIPGLIRGRDDFYLTIRSDKDFSAMSYYINMPFATYIPNTSGTFRTTLELKESDNSPLWKEFIRHATETNMINKQNRAARDIVKAMLDICRTGGQIRLLWPEMVNLLPTWDQKYLGKTVARKPPDCWTEARDGQLLLMARMKEATPLITEGVMLEAAHGGSQQVRALMHDQPVRCYDAS